MAGFDLSYPAVQNQNRFLTTLFSLTSGLQIEAKEIDGSGTPGYPNPWLSGKTRGNQEKAWKIIEFHCFLNDGWDKIHPKTFRQSDHFEPVSASPDHSQPILQEFFERFSNAKNCKQILE